MKGSLNYINFKMIISDLYLYTYHSQMIQVLI